MNNLSIKQIKQLTSYEKEKVYGLDIGSKHSNNYPSCIGITIGGTPPSKTPLFNDFSLLNINGTIHSLRGGEPLLTPDDDRFVVLPVKYNDLYKMYKNAVSCFWVAEEVDLSKDMNDWNKLNYNEKYFISMILAFFACMDGLINENLCLRFMGEVQNSEARLFYGFQIAIEGIHQEVYANLIDTYIANPIEKAKLLNAINDFPCVKKKADWVKDHIQSSDSFAERLVAFICVEGIHFSGAFCAIYWFKSKNLLPGLCFSNELISRDEALHTEFGIALYEKLNNKLSQEKIHSIIKEAVDIETEFIIEALPCRLLGMNSNLMTKYIQFVADRLCIQLGCDKIWNVPLPFSFMETISIERKSNFFECRVSEYALATKDQNEDIFDFNTTF
jgi:ribonucleoside-diphosphate reductase subunit M2